MRKRKPKIDTKNEPSMKTEDYPALYRASNLKAVNAQRTYLRIIFLSLISIIIASTLSLLSSYSIVIAIGASAFFIIGLILSLILASKRYDKTWYLARAVAESVKTLTWRYIMRAEPFDQTDERKSSTHLVGVLREILNENQGTCEIISDNEQMTITMTNIRHFSLDKRIQIYSENRINEQATWYLKKAKYNQRMSDRWFWSITIIQILAIICSLVRIGKLTWNLLPTGILATVVTAALSWMQIKRFQDLSSSYNLTAHEIGFIKTDLESITDEQSFSRFVGDSENAFSREHTQWQARKDIN